MNTIKQKISRREYLALHPEKYVMAANGDDCTLYVAPTIGGKIQVTDNIELAEIWDSLNLSDMRLRIHSLATGLNLFYKQIN